MTRSLARSLTLTLAVLTLGLALASSAQAANPTWLAVSGATGYRASSFTSREPVIFSRSLDSGREERIGVAPGNVSSDGSAANGKSIALVVVGTTEYSLFIFRKGARSVKVDVAKDTECGDEIGRPAELPFAPLSLASDGALTYLKKNASTGCQFWIVRRDPNGQSTRVWMPPSAYPLEQYSSVESKGKLVLLVGGSGIEPPPSIVYNSKSKRIVYTVPERLRGPFHETHLATSGTLGISYPEHKDSSAIRVNLKNHREVRFEFPHAANARFCGKFTVFAGAHLIKVYDELGRTRLRKVTRGFSSFHYPAMCSSKYAPIFGWNGINAALLLNLTSFKLSEFS